MGDTRYGFKLAPNDPVIDYTFGMVPFDTLEAAVHTGSKWVDGYIQYFVSHDRGMTWQKVETDDNRV